MEPGIPTLILLGTLAFGDYTFFLPGPKTWCWPPGDGVPVAYNVETYESGLDVTTTTFQDDSDPCTTQEANRPGEWLVRVQALDAEDKESPWSEWSPGLEVRANMDCNGDFVVGIPDFNCLREVFDKCMDRTGYYPAPCLALEP